MAARLPKILLVEDDAVIRDVNSAKLKLDGFDFVAAEHGEAALRVLKSFTPDIILLDMLMPVMNGLEFLRQYRSDGGQAEVIFFSNNSAPESTREAMALGAAEYLNKSQYTPAQLTTHVINFWQDRQRALV